MKKTLVFALLTLAAASQAVIFPNAFFATPVPFRENFDSTIQGSYNSLPAFGTPALMSRIGTGGSLAVQPFVGANTVPHVLFGDQVDVRLQTLLPMRRFGGFFRAGVLGVFSPTVSFRFFDAFNNPVGSATVPLTATFQWIGFQTFPKWRRVEIYGGIPGFPGAVAMDSLRIRLN